MTTESVTRLLDRIGDDLGTTDWVLIDQAKIDAHAETTGDKDWLHNEPERAAKESPFGKTIAQGFLLMSHLVAMAESLAPPADDVAFMMNYGFDRLRIVRPVLVDSRIRGHFRLKDARPKGDDGFVATLAVEVEAEGQDGPVMVGEWLSYIRRK